MNMSYLKYLFFGYLAILWKINYVHSTSFSNLKWEYDFYSIGDLHGDKDAFIRILLNESIIDLENNVIRNNVLTVITGDVLDPTYDDIDIILFIKHYNESGKSLNSKIILLLGNHEVSNLCLKFKNPQGNVEDYRYRNDMFRKGEEIYNYLIDSPFVVNVNNIIFSHAGVLPFYSTYGIDFINEEGKKEIINNCELLNQKIEKRQELCIACEYGPTLNRYYSYVNKNAFSDSKVCSSLYKSLGLLKSSRMVIGHTVQKNKQVNSYCQDKLLLADTGISKWKNGVISYIQHFNDGSYKVKYIKR
ncbi:hypothetical protein YYG_03788 [Plasmodium vinckei petteri]|uniref:Shewanella-like protein phosphatase 2, putative n=3 Tax=Plasmodium vinckei TaxID=5860 RepID=W7AHE3_PLAVN|nr:hypothetical protein YYG_03788 [Plasmodium vinckei petteri]CAD2099713.1 shewanella-like protein phosphatase 2, putative [Plasmodium vinckei petteri]